MSSSFVAHRANDDRLLVPFCSRSRPTLIRMGIYCRTTKGLGSTDAHQREARRTYIMAEDTKNVRNQPPDSESPYSESMVERGNPSNATKQPSRRSRENQSSQQAQQTPKKDVQGGEMKEHRRTVKHYPP